MVGSGFSRSTTSFLASAEFAEDMRATPTIGISNVAHFNILHGASSGAPSVIVAAVSSTHSGGVGLTCTVAGHTIGNGGYLYLNNVSAWIEYIAEI